MVRLAQVAGRAAAIARARSSRRRPTAARTPARRPISAAAHPGHDQADAERAERRAPARPSRCAAAPICADQRGRVVIMPAADKASDHGTRAEDRRRERAERQSAPVAASSASAPRERGQRRRSAASAASTIRKPPQPTSAAAWLKKVADGATLKAMSVGSGDGEDRRRRRAPQAGTGAGTPAAAVRLLARSRLLQGCLTVTGDAIRLGSRWGMRVLASKRGMIRAPSTGSR